MDTFLYWLAIAATAYSCGDMAMADPMGAFRYLGGLGIDAWGAFAAAVAALGAWHPCSPMPWLRGGHSGCGPSGGKVPLATSEEIGS